MNRKKAATKIAVLVVTSNRGLAGGYNGNVLRLANQTLKDLEATGAATNSPSVVKKAAPYFRFLKRPMAQTYSTLGDKPLFAEIEPLADAYMKAYQEGKISGLKLVYMRFISAGQQMPAVVDVLPLSGIAEAPAAGASGEKAMTITYDFLPSAHALLEELIPTVVKITIFQAFIEAAVSEQIARMVAMKAATDNADKLGKKLTQDYNRARQSQITSELSELMGGVEALK